MPILEKKSKSKLYKLLFNKDSSKLNSKKEIIQIRAKRKE